MKTVGSETDEMQLLLPFLDMAINLFPKAVFQPSPAQTTLPSPDHPAQPRPPCPSQALLDQAQLLLMLQAVGSGPPSLLDPILSAALRTLL